jgi:hypothetical protein
MRDHRTRQQEWDAYQIALSEQAYLDRKEAEMRQPVALDPRCTICGRPARGDLCPRCDEDVDRDYDRWDHAS